MNIKKLLLLASCICIVNIKTQCANQQDIQDMAPWAELFLTNIGMIQNNIGVTPLVSFSAFKLLNLDTTKIPTEQDIKRNYKRQSLKFHPDKNHDAAVQLACAEIFKAIEGASAYLNENLRYLLLPPAPSQATINAARADFLKKYQSKPKEDPADQLRKEAAAVNTFNGIKQNIVSYVEKYKNLNNTLNKMQISTNPDLKTIQWFLNELGIDYATTWKQLNEDAKKKLLELINEEIVRVFQEIENKNQQQKREREEEEAKRKQRELEDAIAQKLTGPISDFIEKGNFDPDMSLAENIRYNFPKFFPNLYNDLDAIIPDHSLIDTKIVELANKLYGPISNKKLHLTKQITQDITEALNNATAQIQAYLEDHIEKFEFFRSDFDKDKQRMQEMGLGQVYDLLQKAINNKLSTQIMFIKINQTIERIYKNKIEPQKADLLKKQQRKDAERKQREETERKTQEETQKEKTARSQQEQEEMHDFKKIMNQAKQHYNQQKHIEAERIRREQEEKNKIPHPQAQQMLATALELATCIPKNR